MPRKQAQQTPTVQKVEKRSLKNVVTVVLLFTLVVVASLFTVSKINNKVEKDKINKYVCEIVDVDMDAHMMGMRCMVRD